MRDPYAQFRHREDAPQRVVPETPTWRYKDLLTALGTAKDVQALLKIRGYNVPEDTIQGWRTRNSIPGKWVPILVQVAVERKFIRGLKDLKLKEA